MEELSHAQKWEKNVKVRRITDENILKFKDELSNVPWEIVLGKDNTENAYNSFLIKFKTLYDRSFQLVRKQYNRNVNIGLQVD